MRGEHTNFPNGQKPLAVIVRKIPTSCTICDHQYMTVPENQDEDVLCGCGFLDRDAETVAPPDDYRRASCPLRKATKRDKKRRAL